MCVICICIYVLPYIHTYFYMLHIMATEEKKNEINAVEVLADVESIYIFLYASL